MYLCDVGNTNATIKKDDKIFSMPIEEFLNFHIDDMVFYINVNLKLKNILRKKDNFMDLKSFFDFSTSYEGMGIDRIAACYSVDDGVIVDAGSAITIDIMERGVHQGGFIIPGFNALRLAYKNISPILDVDMDLHVDLDTIPQSTCEAVNYGILKPIISAINLHVKDKNVFITGGDGEVLSKFMPRCKYKKDLLFDGMMRAIKKNQLDKEMIC